MNPTIEAFVDCINAHDVDGLAALMTVEHVFIDSLGNRMQGRERMRQGWAAYFQMVPDYRIRADEEFGRGTTFALVGSAAGTFAPDGRLREANQWSVPAAWKVELQGGRVSLWQIFADNKRMHELSAADD